MSTTPPRDPWLPPQQEALPRYLDALLRETWEAPAPAFEPVDLVPPAEATSPAAPVPVPAPVVEAPLPLVTSVQLSPAALGRSTISVATTALEVRLFQVAGLTLALPVADLVGVVDSADLVAVEGSEVPWLRGRLCYPHGEIQVVDIAHWVLPPGMAWSPATRHYPVVIIADGRWGLACDQVGAVVRLDPARVRWRSAQTQRRWLAGMVRQPSCALLDPAEFVALFTAVLASPPYLNGAG